MQQAILAGNKFLKGPIRVVPVDRPTRPGLCECFGVVESPVDLQSIGSHAPHAPHHVQRVTMGMACPVEPGDVFYTDCVDYEVVPIPPANHLPHAAATP